MSHHLFPILYALFVWWFSTGLILYLDGMNPRTFRWSMLAATILLAVSLRFIATTSVDPTVNGAYGAFTFALLAWGWLEISFYMGFVTGPRTQACEHGCSGWRHFGHAIEVCLYHELSIIVTAAVVFALAWSGSNHVGIWTFVVLWWMHESAKLNVFLGVRNLNEEFVPAHLAVLKSFLTKKPMNLLFPVSVTISTLIAFVLFQKAFAPAATAFDAAGYTFLGTLMVLAILEHWFLVIPVPTVILWRWGLKSRDTAYVLSSEPDTADTLRLAGDRLDHAACAQEIASFVSNKGEEPRVTAIGRTLDRVRLQAAFDVCAEQARAS